MSKRLKRVLFLVPYPSEGASNRIRVEQFIPYLKEHGYQCRVRPFVNGRFYKILYKRGRHIEKILWFALSTINRIFDLIRAFFYDVIFVHREAYPFGGAFIESILSAMGKPIIFDFDDAIFLPNTSEHNIYIERFKKPGKTADIVRMSSVVIVGNAYLAEYAGRYNTNVIIMPSAIDTDRYCPGAEGSSDSGIVIGWIGSSTTRNFLYDPENAFASISDKYPSVTFKFVGAGFYSDSIKKVINKDWTYAEELNDIRSFDIGIMPMPDSEWTRGKCGFKAILYMACGIPVVCSPVGANLDIVKDGESGLFAKDDKEWVDQLSRLIDDAGLRRDMGRKGREAAVEKYSVKANAPRLLKIIGSVGRANGR